MKDQRQVSLFGVEVGSPEGIDSAPDRISETLQ
jgi:hypothetical protein